MSGARRSVEGDDGRRPLFLKSVAVRSATIDPLRTSRSSRSQVSSDPRSSRPRIGGIGGQPRVLSVWVTAGRARGQSQLRSVNPVSAMTVPLLGCQTTSRSWASDADMGAAKLGASR
jgi:hypothetical protein